MNRFLYRMGAAARILMFGCAVLIGVAGSDARAQDANAPANFLDRVFGRGAEPAGEAPGRVAQLSASDLMMRLDRMEEQIRRLTGTIEQLQFRNQQLEQQLRRAQEDNEFRFQELGSKGGSRSAPPRRSENDTPERNVAAPAPQRAAPAPVAPAPAAPEAVARPGRGDAFDPSANPNAPGVPRVLGSSQPAPQGGDDNRGNGEQPIGAPGGRAAGAPLDLTTLAGRAIQDPSLAPSGSVPSNTGTLPAPPPRNPSATGGRTAMVAPPSNSPKDAYDLAYGYVLHKDYALAEQAFRAFLEKYPGNSLTADVNYWLGETYFQRQRYRDAAEYFLTVTKKFDTSAKAPEALFRLGQSLAALGEKETACASMAEIARKYPRASVSLKKGVKREKKRARC